MFCCLLLEAVLAATWLRLQVKKNRKKLTSRGTTSGRNREQSPAHAFCEIIFNLFWFIMILTSFIQFFNMFKCNDLSNVVWCNQLKKQHMFPTYGCTCHFNHYLK